MLAVEQATKARRRPTRFAILAAQPQQQLAAAIAEVRSILVRAEHPGALPRMPGGRSGAGRAEGRACSRC